MGRTIGIVSAKGGVGKTICTINLAAALMEHTKQVVALDADVKLSGLSLQLGMYYFPVTLNDVLKGGRSLLESLYIHSTGLRIIPASLSVAKGGNLVRLQEVLQDASLAHTTVLVDCPPGLESNAFTVVKACPEIILVTTPEIPAVTDILKTISLAKKTKSKLLGIIVNRYQKGQDQVSAREIAATCELPVLGVIPEDPMVRKSVFARTPAVLGAPYARSSLAFKEMAAHLMGELYSPPRYASLRRLVKSWKA